MFLHIVIKQAASHLKRQQYLKFIIPGKVVQERKSRLKWATQSKSNMGQLSGALPCICTNRTTSGFNIGKIAFCGSNSRDKEGYFVLTAGTRKAQFVHPGESENRPKTSKMFCKRVSTHFWSNRSLPVEDDGTRSIEGLHPTVMVEGWALSGPNIAASVQSIPHML